MLLMAGNMLYDEATDVSAESRANVSICLGLDSSVAAMACDRALCSDRDVEE
jgi:hypothetical protein